MDTDNEVYDYDKCLFFRLLLSSKYRIKFEFIQQQEGLVVCPLQINLNNNNNINIRNTKINEIIDRHLFVPSPYYKNHFIPLNSLIAISSLTSTNVLNNSLPLDHSQQINLLLNESNSTITNNINNNNNQQTTNNTPNELILYNFRRRICKNVKILNIQTAYTTNNKSYKILIVNRALVYKRATAMFNHFNLNQFQHHQRLLNQINSENEELDEKDENDLDADYDEININEMTNMELANSDYDILDMNGNSTSDADSSRNSSSNSLTNGRHFKQRRLSERRSIQSISGISHNNTTFMNQIAFKSLNDVKTFAQSIDFMHDTAFISNEYEYNSNENESADMDNNYDNKFTHRRPSSFSLRNSRISISTNTNTIGEDLLSELELFRKTHIIVYTHLEDCCKQLTRIHSKYVRKFLNSYKKAQIDAGFDADSVSSTIDLMLSIACENTIIGFLYPKIWPCVLRLNSDKDEQINLKCKQLINYLKLSKIDLMATSTIPKLSVQSIDLCSRFFKIDKKYFTINIYSILKELKRLPLLNNPFEKLDCVKVSIDLLTNELSISSKDSSSISSSSSSSSASSTSSLESTKLVKEDSSSSSSPSSSSTSSNVLTTDLLIPLISFILIRLNLNCLQSIMGFIDRFHLSMQPNNYSTSQYSTQLAELSFFITTFNAAIEFILTSSIEST